MYESYTQTQRERHAHTRTHPHTHTVIDHGIASVEMLMEEALQDIPPLVKDIQERLRRTCTNTTHRDIHCLNSHKHNHNNMQWTILYTSMLSEMRTPLSF